MTELTWFILVLWIMLAMYFLKSKNTMVGGTAGAIGAFFSLTLISEAAWLGFILMIFNFYLLYASIFGGKTRGS